MQTLTFSQALEGYVLFAAPKLFPNTLKDYFNTFRKSQEYFCLNGLERLGSQPCPAELGAARK